MNEPEFKYAIQDLRPSGRPRPSKGYCWVCGGWINEKVTIFDPEGGGLVCMSCVEPVMKVERFLAQGCGLARPMDGRARDRHAPV